MLQVALIGDFHSSIKAHLAIPKALEFASQSLSIPVKPHWLSTQILSSTNSISLHEFDAFWCTPGSPYVSMEGALTAIQFAREQKKPFLGTCGGFQHALIEYARNVLGHKQADHAESNPNASLKLIAPLSCSLVEQQGRILLQPGSKAAHIYQAPSIQETYHCNYGVNPSYRALLEQGGLLFSGFDENKEPRIFELFSHPFFLGTLFQPERSAFVEKVHPLIEAFVEATKNTKDKANEKNSKNTNPS